MAYVFFRLRYVGIICILCFLALSPAALSLAATSVTQSGGALDAGIEGIPSLPGKEITPQDMQTRFPAPLGGSAPNIPFIPDAAPLIPALPLQEAGTQKKDMGEQKHHEPNAQGTESIVYPSVTPVVVPSSPQPAQEKEDNALPDSGYRTPQQKALEESLLKSMGQWNSPADPSSALGKAVLPVDGKNTAFPPLEIMLGQMIMAGFTGTEVETFSPIITLVKAGKVGGVFLEPVPPVKPHVAGQEALLPMAQSGYSAQQSAAALVQVQPHGNIASAGQLRRLIATLQSYVPKDASPLWVAVEQEGGAVQALRPDLGFEGLASAARLGQDTPEKTEIAVRRSAVEMGGMGINFVLGPAADVNVNPLSENIGQRFRSFNRDAQSVAEHVMAFGRGMLAANILPCLRNFPGTGSYVRGFSQTASHTQSTTNILQSLPDISYAWQQRELTPYKESVERHLGLVQKAGQEQVYFAIQPALAYHRTLDALRPIPLSPTALQSILRGQWAFKGLVLSQDIRALQPFFSLEESVLQSVLAGADILFVTEPPVLVNPASSPLAGLGVLSSLPGMGSMEALAGLLDGAPQGEAGNAGGNEEALMRMLMQNGAGKFLPGSFGAEVKAKPTTGVATQAEKLYTTLLSLVKAGRISEARVRESWLRITAAKKSLNIMP